MTSLSFINAEHLKDAKTNASIIIDVRTQKEHDEKSLARPHILIPLDQLNPTEFMTDNGLDQNSPVYILCRSGMRATQAGEKFINEGFNNIHVIEGGIMACEACGYDIK